MVEDYTARVVFTDGTSFDAEGFTRTLELDSALVVEDYTARVVFSDGTSLDAEVQAMAMETGGDDDEQTGGYNIVVVPTLRCDIFRATVSSVGGCVAPINDGYNTVQRLLYTDVRSGGSVDFRLPTAPGGADVQQSNMSAYEGGAWWYPPASSLSVDGGFTGYGWAWVPAAADPISTNLIYRPAFGLPPAPHFTMWLEVPTDGTPLELDVHYANETLEYLETLKLECPPDNRKIRLSLP